MAIGQDRIARLQEVMRPKNIDALVCLKPQSSFYLSGFNPIMYSHPVVAILPVAGEPVLLVHALRDDHARQSAWVHDVRLFGAWSTKRTMGSDWLAALRAILEERGVARGTLGVDGDFLPIRVMRQLEERLPEARFTDVSDLIMDCRTVKDEAEIARLRTAVKIVDIGIDAGIAAAAERVSEREVSIRAMAAMNRAWVDRYPEYEVAAFGSLEEGIQNGCSAYCLTGDRIAINSDNPTSRRLAEGELALIIAHATCDGMHSENERTVAVGKIGDDQRRAFEAILRIREEAQVAIRPGVTGADVYQAARVVYERLGYGKYLPGRIGHGMGLGVHEHPSIAPADKTVLRPGMVLTFEPNLRIPEWGGLQHSDTVLVTRDGAEFLTQTRRDLIQV